MIKILAPTVGKLNNHAIGLIAAVALLCAWPASAQAASAWKRCSQLKKEGYFLPAADCFAKVAAKIKVDEHTTERRRVRKWYLYREACKSLEKAAAKSQLKAQAAYLRERAVTILRTLLKRRWLPKIRGKRRGRNTRAMLAQFLDKIQYTPLAISTGRKDATIALKGYQFQASRQGQFNQKLRPGTYHVTVTYPKKKPKRRKIQLSAGRSVVLTFAENPGIPVISWIGYTVGSAALVGGGVMLTMGILGNKDVYDCYEDQQCFFANGGICRGTSCGKSSDETAKTLQTRAAILMAFGAVAIAAGASLLIVGGVAHKRANVNDVKRREGVASAMPRPQSKAPKRNAQTLLELP